jgi:hypothetical protein
MRPPDVLVRPMATILCRLKTHNYSPIHTQVRPTQVRGLKTHYYRGNHSNMSHILAWMNHRLKKQTVY